MDLRKYKTLIGKIIQRSSGKKLTGEQIADNIITAIMDIEEMLRDNPIELSRQEKPAFMENAILPVAEASNVDITERVREEEKPEFIERFTVEQLRDFAQNQMPSLLKVKPAGFDQPFEIRKYIENAPGDLAYVRIIYQQEDNQITNEGGQRIGPTVQIMSTDERLDADKLTDDVVRQANSMYTKNRPAVLTPRRPVVVGNGPGDLRNALGADIGGRDEDPSTGITAGDAAALKDWSKNLGLPSIGKFGP